MKAVISIFLIALFSCCVFSGIIILMDKLADLSAENGGIWMFLYYAFCFAVVSVLITVLVLSFMSLY